jgi:hypothetical protein
MEQTLRLQVVTFDTESQNTTDKAALRVYPFDLEAPGLHPGLTDFLSTNTLPSNTSDLYFPGFFHSEPRSRLLALKVGIPFVDGPAIPCVFYVQHNVLLDYIRSHPSDPNTLVVPWEAWGPGNVHIFSPPQLHNPSKLKFLGCKMVCGMHAITEPPMVIGEGDQKILRIMDYHPRRIVRNLVSQDTHLRGAADLHKGLGPPGPSVQQEAPDKDIPYAFKDIPLPGGLRLGNIKCVLGEDVVAVFEVGIPSLMMACYEGAHSIQVFF